MVLVAQQHRGESNGNHFMPRTQNTNNNLSQVMDMTISIEKKIKQPSAAKLSNEVKNKVSTDELKSLFEQVLNERQEEVHMNWEQDNKLVVDQLSGLTLHNFLLKVEELGKNITFTKKTVIEIH